MADAGKTVCANRVPGFAKRLANILALALVNLESTGSGARKVSCRTALVSGLKVQACISDPVARAPGSDIDFAGQIIESANPIAHRIAATASDITIQNFQ